MNRDTMKFIVKLEHIIEQIERFNEFEHSLDYENAEVYDNFLCLTRGIVKRWEEEHAD